MSVDVDNRTNGKAPHRLLAVVKKEVVATLDKQPEDTVPVWPNLVVLEFIAAIVFSLGLLAVSWLVNAPLVEIANPDRTPNPAKAPWYFLNLQELLLHMDPALAGVIVPGVALLALMVIPYIDRVEAGEKHRWFTSGRGAAITVFSSVYSALVLIWLILFDHFVGVKAMLAAAPLGLEIAGWIVPVIVMLFFSFVLVVLVRAKWKASRREVLIALFTGFIVSYLVLTIVGSAFRGAGMELFWPWEVTGHAG